MEFFSGMVNKADIVRSTILFVMLPFIGFLVPYMENTVVLWICILFMIVLSLNPVIIVIKVVKHILSVSCKKNSSDL